MAVVIDANVTTIRPFSRNAARRGDRRHGRLQEFIGGGQRSRCFRRACCTCGSFRARWLHDRVQELRPSSASSAASFANEAPSRPDQPLSSVPAGLPACRCTGGRRRGARRFERGARQLDQPYGVTGASAFGLGVLVGVVEDGGVLVCAPVSVAGGARRFPFARGFDAASAFAPRRRFGDDCRRRRGRARALSSPRGGALRERLQQHRQARVCLRGARAPGRSRRRPPRRSRASPRPAPRSRAPRARGRTTSCYQACCSFCGAENSPTRYCPAGRTPTVRDLVYKIANVDQNCGDMVCSALRVVKHPSNRS